MREGAITKQQIIDVVGDIFTAPEPEPSEEEAEDAAGEQGEDGEPGTSTESAEGASDAAPAGEADGDAPSVLDLPSEPELESVPQGPAETPLAAPGEDAAAPSDVAPSTSEPSTAEASTAGSSGSGSLASEPSTSGSTAAAPEDRPDDGPARPEHMPG